jgi:hypothetical protein
LPLVFFSRTEFEFWACGCEADNNAKNIHPRILQPSMSGKRNQASQKLLHDDANLLFGFFEINLQDEVLLNDFPGFGPRTFFSTVAGA